MSRAILSHSLVYFLGVLSFTCLISGDVAAESMAPIAFVSSLVDDLSHIQHLRDKAANDATAAGGDYTRIAVGCIRYSTSLALELRSQAQRYRDIKLGENFSSIGPSIADIWMQDADLNDQFVANCESLFTLASNI